jgi:hypothetical protein
LFFVTCGDGLSDGSGGGSVATEYTDWEYVELSNGTAQLTLYLDGTAPIPVSRSNRALSEGIAKRSHDLFEAVFMADGGQVARASWEIGQSAGITGVRRGVDYSDIDPAAITSTKGAALICVGRKATRDGTEGTLLAVGYLSHIDKQPIGSGSPAVTGIIAAGTRNVTFTVSALTTKIGYELGSSAPAIELDEMDEGDRDTFWTSAAAIATTTPPPAATEIENKGKVPIVYTNTIAGTATFKNGATFTMFGLPAYNATLVPTGGDHVLIGARYKFGGFVVPAGHTTTSVHPASDLDLASSLFVWDVDEKVGQDYTVSGGELNFQILERLAIYQTLGTTYDVTSPDLDTVTTVALHNTAVPVSTSTPPFTTGKYADHAPFDPNIPLEFKVFEKSGGAFAITFQVPVYALAREILDGTTTPITYGIAASTNGGPSAIKWYVRPAHSQSQFLLDDGMNAGGMVLLGVGVSDTSFLDIYVHGFGFTN